MRCTSALALALGALPLSAQRAGDRLLVCNKAEDTVSIFDARDGAELATLPTGPAPREVAVGPAGRTAVVANYGRAAAGHTLTVVDVVDGEVLRTIDLTQPDGPTAARRRRPRGVGFVAADHALVSCEAARQLLRVDVGSGRVVAAWPTAGRALQTLSVGPGGRTAAATTTGDGAVAVFDLALRPGGAPPKFVATGSSAEGVAVHPRTGDVWVANGDDDTVTVVSAASGRVVRTLVTGSRPLRVAFTPDGALALVPCVETGELMIFDGAAVAPLREVSIHGDRSEQSSLPVGVTSGSDGRRAYVTCARGEFVAVVDLASAEVVDRIDARKGPDGVAYARPSTAARKR